MNCAQHTDTAASAYCCNCGKALCPACKRDVQGAIFCEPCLAARLQSAGSTAARAPENATPELALFLGFIPGVGAFYNGQFLKGFVHVIVLCTLIFLSDHGMHGMAGLLIAAWFFYMVFDAYTTAKARRYGLPIPDPIGLNAILEGDDGTVRQRVERAGERFGESVEQASQHFRHQWHQAGGATPHFPPGEAAPSDVGQANYNAAPGSIAPPEHERSPVGALVLIALGVLFLLSNLGWFSFFWIDRYWPVILIVTGLWLFIKRQRGTR